jgi:SagB-type dehydrogenase family enzyme
MTSNAALTAAIAYHERSKHDHGRFARSLGYLDWETQPDPFRRYEGAPLMRLDLPRGDSTGPSYEQLHHPGAIPPRPLDARGVSSFLFHSLALSAWKRFQAAHWSLRVNPSSGNLHPTEGWLVLPALPGLGGSPGVFHYAPKEHGLEQRSRLDEAAWGRLVAGLPEGAFLVALSSIPWRESWKYGERAWRYCQHDAGHALAALRYGAALLGWRLLALPDVPDDDLAGLLGLDRSGEFVEEEPEHPELLAVVLTQPGADDERLVGWRPSGKAVAALRGAEWTGRANLLSSGHVGWPVIDEVEAACRKDASASLAEPPPGPTALLPLDRSDDVPPAARIIRQRRSAVAMDGRTGLTRKGFYEMLSRVVPDRCAVPWDALSWPTLVHLGLFVHRVADLAPGLYLLARRADRVEALRAMLKSDFVWRRPQACPDALPLYLLAEGDVAAHATSVSCGQDIAGDSAFSLGMLAEFEGPLARLGAPLYRHLFWETGAIGQTLYLEAEAAGIRATGIGCFFDEPVHRLFGVAGRSLQSLYHFTVGGAVDAQRLTTEPAYPGVRVPA